MSDARGGIAAIGATNPTYYTPNGAQSDLDIVTYGYPYGAETAVATGITDDISSVADGSVSLCAAGRDDAGNWQSTPTKTTWTKDTVLPAISSGYYSGTSVVLTMSKPVYSALATGGFAVDDDGTELTGRPRL